MSIFSSILNTLGLHKKPAPAPAKKESAAPAGAAHAGPLASAAVKPAASAAPKPAAPAHTADKPEPAPKAHLGATKPADKPAASPKAHLGSEPTHAAPKATLANTIGQHKPAEPAPAPAASAAPAAAAPAPAPEPVPAPEPAAEPAPEAVSVVDVVADLEARAAKHAEKLNWKVSIVDLLKLLGIDSSFAARKELAEELGCPADLMGDSAKMNTWLHKTVLARIAENGGNIPASLLD